jgi:dihydroorotate dehydrogenase (NAD+) catalytic subunit
MPDISTKIGKLKLQSPVMGASGTFGGGSEYADFLSLGRLGAIIAKTVTLEPREGNPPPRTCETPAGLLNSIGLANVGVERFVREELPKLSRYGPPVIVNIAGSQVEEYAALAELLDSRREAAALEVNVSCPNVKYGGIAFGVSASDTARVTKAVRGKFRRTLIVKLSPNVTDIGAIAAAAESAGADALTCANTYRGMCVNWRERRSRIGMATGGVSGPAIKPLTLARVWECFKAVKIPIIGCGGIASAEDVLEYASAGASAVQVGTMNFVDYSAMESIIAEIPRLLKQAGVKKFSDVIGSLSESD